MTEVRDVLVEEQKREPTILAQIVEKEMKKNGPIPFSRFMNIWNSGIEIEGTFMPGFYSGNATIGNQDGELEKKRGDFVTPPEETPLFGFMIAKQILQMWEHMGKPEDFKIVEMGAGMGTLANDVLHGLRHFSKDPSFASSIKYVIVEKSPSLIEKQKDRLSNFKDQVDFVRGSAVDLPLKNITGVVLSSELPDTFPLHVVRKTKEGWKEMFVTSSDTDTFDRVWGPSTQEAQSFIEKYPPPIEEEKTYAVNVDAVKWMENISKTLDRGFVLTVDYNYWRDENIRLFAAKEKGINVNEPNAIYKKTNMGLADMTTGVDFQMLIDVGKKYGLDPLGFVNLQGFLFGLGADLEVKKLPQESVLGDRKRRLFKDADFIEDNRWDVLVQAKGVKETQDFYSLKFKFDPNKAGRTEQHLYEQFYKNIKL